MKKLLGICLIFLFLIYCQNPIETEIIKTETIGTETTLKTIKYKVLDSAETINITMVRANNTTEQYIDAQSGWIKSWQGESGDYIFISAQRNNDNYDAEVTSLKDLLDVGAIREEEYSQRIQILNDNRIIQVFIYVDDILYRSAISNGAYAIIIISDIIP